MAKFVNRNRKHGIFLSLGGDTLIGWVKCDNNVAYPFHCRDVIPSTLHLGEKIQFETTYVDNMLYAVQIDRLR